jgi:hypothetical protein
LSLATTSSAAARVRPNCMSAPTSISGPVFAGSIFCSSSPRRRIARAFTDRHFSANRRSPSAGHRLAAQSRHPDMRDDLVDQRRDDGAQQAEEEIGRRIAEGTLEIWKYEIAEQQPGDKAGAHGLHMSRWSAKAHCRENMGWPGAVQLSGHRQTACSQWPRMTRRIAMKMPMMTVAPPLAAPPGVDRAIRVSRGPDAIRVRRRRRPIACSR